MVHVLILNITRLDGVLAVEGELVYATLLSVSINFSLILPYADGVQHVERVGRMTHHEHVRGVAVVAYTVKS